MDLSYWIRQRIDITRLFCDKGRELVVHVSQTSRFDRHIEASPIQCWAVGEGCAQYGLVPSVSFY